MTKTTGKPRSKPKTAPEAAAPQPASPPLHAGGGAVAVTTAESRPNYLVLARKYRPQTFDDLIGQDVLVRTLRNAFAMDRIAHAYMLTGVRGVGKTTTARILARAFNYQLDGGPDKPTLDMPVRGIHCGAIIEGRHVDVLEMDAASHTGIDDIREIIEAVRYKPAAARYRVFIVDEVHMLSKAAFNGLLKTLEEPPPHVKFIFATTEIRKVPVTVLSRCQRFDLRRVDDDLLRSHFAGIVALEGRTAEPEALAAIARAAEGSVRDGLSLLDQALALGGGHVEGETVRGMLGVAGRSAIFSLLDKIMAGDAPGVLDAFGALYASGADVSAILADLAGAVHTLSRLKAIPGAYPGDFSHSDRAHADALTSDLGMSRLALAWQMLLKGIEEVSRAGRPVAAAEMLLIRMCYAAGLPSPADVIAELKKGRASLEDRAQAPPPPALRPVSPVPADTLKSLNEAVPNSVSEDAAETPKQDVRFNSFRDIAAYAGEKRDIKLKLALEENVELVKFEPGYIEIHALDGAAPNLAIELSKKLQAWTGERWVVSLSEARGQASLAAKRRQAEADSLADVSQHPSVRRVLHHFPGAEIKGIRPSPEEQGR